MDILIGLPSSIPTPSAGNVTPFFDTTYNPARYSYKDSSGVVHPFTDVPDDVCHDIAKEMITDISCAVGKGIIPLADFTKFVQSGVKVACDATDDGAGNTTSSVTISNITVPATGVTLFPTVVNPLNVGASIALIPTVTPANATNKNVIWSSSNNARATVTSTGVVTGVAAGAVVITSTTIDGAFTAICNVTVV